MSYEAVKIEQAIAEGQLLEATISIFQDMRSRVVRAMELLHETKQAGVWVSVADSWGEFCEQSLGISQGYASKLLSTWEHYVINGGLKADQIAGIDYEKLYAARSLPGTITEQAAMASTLSRREIKETKNENVEHTHEVEYVPICKTCGMRVYEKNTPEKNAAEA